jgi:L-histidine Nalpha-methyltransferase
VLFVIDTNMANRARLKVVDLHGTVAVPGADVRQGLTSQPKTIPAQYFYDAVGSQLFEQICELPEYYLTRTETAIFQACADELVALTGDCEIVELGSGSSTKTRILLDAYQKLGKGLDYCPIDVSPTILELSATQLLQDYPDLEIHALVGTYDLALEKLPMAAHPRMICFIGSSLGNFSPAECDAFLGRVAHTLQPGEFFLLGVDLRKDVKLLEAAYDDAQGVTAAFNLNMLRHLNQRFRGNFDLSQFEHVAVYNRRAHQIEMHLRSLQSQTVTLADLALEIFLEEEEMILSEISRKFDLDEMVMQLASKNLVKQQIWTDSQGWFGVILCQRV